MSVISQHQRASCRRGAERVVEDVFFDDLPRTGEFALLTEHACKFDTDRNILGLGCHRRLEPAQRRGAIVTLPRQMAETDQRRCVLRMCLDHGFEHALRIIEARCFAQRRCQLATQVGIFRIGLHRCLEIAERGVDLTTLARDMAEPGQRADMFRMRSRARF